NPSQASNLASKYSLALSTSPPAQFSPHNATTNAASVSENHHTATNATSTEAAPGSVSSLPSPTNRKMITLTVNGVDIEYPESVNIWLEPEEGNVKYLKGPELESQQREMALASGATSPPTRALNHRKG